MTLDQLHGCSRVGVITSGRGSVGTLQSAYRQGRPHLIRRMLRARGRCLGLGRSGAVSSAPMLYEAAWRTRCCVDLFQGYTSLAVQVSGCWSGCCADRLEREAAVVFAPRAGTRILRRWGAATSRYCHGFGLRNCVVIRCRGLPRRRAERTLCAMILCVS